MLGGVMDAFHYGDLRATNIVDVVEKDYTAMTATVRIRVLGGRDLKKMDPGKSAGERASERASERAFYMHVRN